MNLTKKEREGIEKALELNIELRNRLMESQTYQTDPATLFKLEQDIKSAEAKIRDLKSKLGSLYYIHTSEGETELKIIRGHEITEPVGVSVTPSVFISYNHGDRDAMFRVRADLEANQITVIVDEQDMQAAEDIQSFINKSLQNARFILTLVSEKSLRSGWVSRELSAAALLGQTGKIWLPATLDDAVFKDDFYRETDEYITEELRKLDARMIEDIQNNRDTRPYEPARARLRDLKNNLGPSIANLREKLLVNISGAQFEQGMQKIRSVIHNNR